MKVGLKYLNRGYFLEEYLPLYEILEDISEDNLDN